MIETRCDICKRKIKNSDKVSIDYSYSWQFFHFCGKCASPVISFLNKNKLISKLQNPIIELQNLTKKKRTVSMDA